MPDPIGQSISYILNKYKDDRLTLSEAVIKIKNVFSEYYTDDDQGMSLGK